MRDDNIYGNTLYLFELDSVRSTPLEQNLGKSALYTSLLNGNSVILSYNQLSDSAVMSDLLGFGDASLTRDVILQLMRNGRIMLSRFGDVRTFSQYMQGKMNPGSFRFSYLSFLNQLPAAHPVFDCIVQTLKNDEPDRIAHIDELYDMSEFEPLAAGQRVCISEWCNVMLDICRTVQYTEPTSADRRTLGEYALMIFDALDLYASENGMDEYTAKRAREYYVQARSECANSDFRGPLINTIAAYEYNPAARLAVCVIDIAYNYTVEGSICGITRTHPSDARYLARLTGLYLREHLSTAAPDKVIPSDWSPILRLTRIKKNRSTPQTRKEWLKMCRGNLFSEFFSSVSQALIALVVSIISWYTGGVIGSLLSAAHAVLIVRLLLEAVLLTVAFDLIGTRLHTSGITESAANFKRFRYDRRIFTSNRKSVTLYPEQG